ncbi:MAG: MerR family transcriptional regulator [Anaerolineae bacterium]
MHYTPKEIADMTGMSLDTLRYYERLGLLDPVARASSGHRRYSEADLRRLDFLKRLKATGMPLNDMVHYVALFRQGEPTITERREILEAHREKVAAQMALLMETLTLLDGKIANYRLQENALMEQAQQIPGHVRKFIEREQEEHL